MPTTTWYVGSNSTTDSPTVFIDYYKDAPFTVTVPRSYTIDTMAWYAAADTVNVVYVSCELYVGADLIAKTTEKLVTATSVQQYGFSRTSNNAGGSWAYQLTSSTTFTFRIKFRNSSGGPRNCTYYAWTDGDGQKKPYGLIAVSYPGSGAFVQTSSGSWIKRPVKVWNGSSWVRRPVKVFDGSTWRTH